MVGSQVVKLRDVDYHKFSADSKAHLNKYLLNYTILSQTYSPPSFSKTRREFESGGEINTNK